MSILKRKPVLTKFLSNCNTQEESNIEHVMQSPSIVVNDVVSTVK